MYTSWKKHQAGWLPRPLFPRSLSFLALPYSLSIKTFTEECEILEVNTKRYQFISNSQQKCSLRIKKRKEKE